MTNKKKIILQILFIILVALITLISSDKEVMAYNEYEYYDDDLVTLKGDYWTSPYIYCLNAHRKNPSTRRKNLV